MLINQWVETTKPLKDFADFQLVSWEQDIYPKYKGKKKQSEVNFLCNIIMSHGLKKVIDFGIGGGTPFKMSRNMVN